MSPGCKYDFIWRLHNNNWLLDFLWDMKLFKGEKVEEIPTLKENGVGVFDLGVIDVYPMT